MSEKRLYIGNLPNDIDENEIRNKLSKFKITSVDIKRKEMGEKTSVFAFVNVSDKYLKKCLKTLQNDKWRNHKLKIEIAKESFMERLKKERMHKLLNASSADITPTTNFVDAADKPNKKVVFTDEDAKSPVIINGKLGDDSRNKSVDQPDVFSKKKVPMFKGLSFYDEAKLEDGSNFMKRFEKFSDVWNDEPTRADEAAAQDDNEQDKKDRKKNNLSNVKRMEAMRKKVDAINRKRNTIKNSLKLNNQHNKKIIFDNEIKDSTSINNGQEAEKPEKIVLFEDNSSDDDIVTNFESKPHLEGVDGLKMLKLKSKLSNDDRFKLDERFFEPDSTNVDGTPVYNGEGPRLNEDVISVKRSKFNKPIIRFDPTNPNHQNLRETTDSAADSGRKKKKKKRSKNTGEKENKKTEDVIAPKPVVSKEKHYTVSANLKDALISSDKETSFRLTELFDSQLKKDNHLRMDEKSSNTDKSPKKIIKKVENPFDEPDSDSEEIDEKPLDIPLNVAPEKVLGKCGIWSETFFFKPDDSRLKEAMEFYKRVPGERRPDYSKQRCKLRSIVRRKIQHSKRDSRMFKRKLGGKLNKDRFKMRIKKLQKIS